MEKPVYGFFVALFNVLLVYIVFANFLGWSGGAISVFGNSNVDWTNSYIGFESLISATNDFKSVLSDLQGELFTLDKLLVYSENLLSTIVFNIPKFLNKMINTRFNWGLVLDCLLFVVQMFLQPVIIFGYTMLIVACLLIYVIAFIRVIFAFLGGAYNITMTNTDEVWNQWSSLSSEWDWERILSTNVM